MQVTLLIPWLNQEDQAIVFHGKHSFSSPEQQTECIKDWLRQRTGFEPQCQINYYPGRYDTRLLGIFPVGDLTVYIPAEQASTCQKLLPVCLLRAVATFWHNLHVCTYFAACECPALQNHRTKRYA